MAIFHEYRQHSEQKPAAPSGWLGAGLRALWGLVLGLLTLAAHAQRPQLRLDLGAASSTRIDQAYVYVEAGASPGFDASFDAPKLPNSSGLNLATLLSGGQQFAIKGLPPSLLATSYVLGLFMNVPQDDVYSLQVGQLDNFGLATVYLIDAQLQTRQQLALGTTYTFPLSGASTGGTYTTTRFSLEFEPIAEPLPVTLVSFMAQAQGPDALLQWTTASELRNDYFVVESSPDGTTFQALGQVAGHSTSSQAHSYQLLDRTLARYGVRTVYYRLRQVDLDGMATYSPVRAVAMPLTTQGLLVQVYPNPSAVAAAVTLVLQANQAGAVTLLLTDVLGRQLSQQQGSLPVGTSSWPLAGSTQLVTGVYLLRVQQGEQVRTLKLVRQ